MAASITVGYGLAFIQTMAIWGGLSVVGFDGFAYAKDVQDFKAEQKKNFTDLKESQEELKQMLRNTTNLLSGQLIATQIVPLRARYCEALRTRQFQVAEDYDNQISQLQTQYHTFMGFDFAVRPCPGG